MMNVALGTIEQAILYYHFEVVEKSFEMPMDQHAQPDRTTSLWSAWSMALSAIIVECE